VRRIVGECTDVDERDAVGIRLEPAAAIDENQEGTRGSNPIAPAESRANFILELRGDIALGRRRFVTERVSVYKSTRPN
jgi:hypothetical protein